MHFVKPLPHTSKADPVSLRALVMSLGLWEGRVNCGGLRKEIRVLGKDLGILRRTSMRNIREGRACLAPHGLALTS